MIVRIDELENYTCTSKKFHFEKVQTINLRSCFVENNKIDLP